MYPEKLRIILLNYLDEIHCHKKFNLDISKLVDSKNQRNVVAVTKNTFKNGVNPCLYLLMQRWNIHHDTKILILVLPELEEVVLFALPHYTSNVAAVVIHWLHRHTSK